MNYTDEAWEEEQMSNLGCESVSDLIAEVKRLREELNYARVTLDEWDKSGPCVTVYHEGCEYVGCLRLYKNADGEVIE